MNPEDYVVITTDNTSPLNNIGKITFPTGAGLTGTTMNTISTFNPDSGIDDLLDKNTMNQLVINHKVQAQELIKLKEVAPDYADEIKNNISKKAAQEITKKMTFTKKHDVDSDVHHFIGRVWVFTEAELKQLLKEAKNVY